MDVTYVEDFKEIKTESGDDESKPTTKRRKRGPPRVWRKAAEFETPEEAEEYVSSKLLWRKASTKHSRDGTRIEYRCSAGKYRVNECPAGLYILYHATNTKVSVFETESGHDNHDSGPSRGLSVDMKNFVKDLFEGGIQKPNAILAAVRQKNCEEPDKEKLITYLKQLRSEKYGQPTVSAAEIQKWCETKEETPADDDEPFVLDYLIQAGTQSTEEQNLKIVVSTKRLLSNLKKSTIVQTDATHTLFWQGYPIIIIGTSDKNQVFHPVGLAICRDVATDDFTFIFQTFRKFESQWNPTILLADGSDAITKGFRSVLGEPTVRVACFSDTLKNLEKNFKGLKNDVGTLSQLKQDIHAIQTCAVGSSFQKATELFMSKWKARGCEMDEFFQYFEERTSKFPIWYEGAAPGYPSTNSGIEVIIRNERTVMREKLPVSQFLDNAVKVISKWSKSRDINSANCVHFAVDRETTIQQWTAAYQWATKNVKVLQQTDEDPQCTTFFVNSSVSNAPITSEDVLTYNETIGKWTSFEEFQKVYYGTWKIILNKENLESCKCSCPYFLKRSTCKHILGMQIRLHLVKPPAEAKIVGSRKRGRPPSQTKKAILT